MIYLIEKLWTDSMENDYHAAVGYAPAGYVETEEEAKRIVSEGGVATYESHKCWALSTFPKPVYKYSVLSRYKPAPATDMAHRELPAMYTWEPSDDRPIGAPFHDEPYDDGEGFKHFQD